MIYIREGMNLSLPPLVIVANYGYFPYKCDDNCGVRLFEDSMGYLFSAL
jgi:hypothetical protein